MKLATFVITVVACAGFFEVGYSTVWNKCMSLTQLQSINTHYSIAYKKCWYLKKKQISCRDISYKLPLLPKPLIVSNVDWGSCLYSVGKMRRYIILHNTIVLYLLAHAPPHPAYISIFVPKCTLTLAKSSSFIFYFVCRMFWVQKTNIATPIVAKK